MPQILYLDLPANEVFELRDGLDDLVFFKDKSISFSFTDLYVALQTFDMLDAYLYAQVSLDKMTTSPIVLLNFIMEAHKRIAKHLLMLYVHNDDSVAGKYATTQPFVENDCKLNPTTVPVTEIPLVMENFSKVLYEKIKGMKRSAEAYHVAAFALAEIGRIHPFPNGNGRLGRLLMNCILTLGACKPTSFQDKDSYYSVCKTYVEHNNTKDLAKKIASSSLREKDSNQRDAIDSLEMFQSNFGGNQSAGLRLYRGNLSAAHQGDGYGVDLDHNFAKDAVDQSGNHQDVRMFFTRFKYDVFAAQRSGPAPNMKM